VTALDKPPTITTTAARPVWVAQAGIIFIYAQS